MAIDIIGHINTESSLTTEKKIAMLNDYVEYYGYQEEIDGEPNPQTKKNFANEKMLQELKDKVKSVRKRRAEESVEYEELTLNR